MADNISASQTEKRPTLDKNIPVEDFRSFYWLKEELVAFCRVHDIKTGGSKEELQTRIANFLSTGKAEQIDATKPMRKVSSKRKQVPSEQGPLSLSTLITSEYRSDEQHRAFFKTVIGPHFHFTVHFMNFLKENSGKTYQDAVDEWYREEERKKNPAYRTVIAPQFEYNRYMRDFFEHNPGKTLQDAIAAWNAARTKRGSTAYAPHAEEIEQ